jgi:hypothetical protein
MSKGDGAVPQPRLDQEQDGGEGQQRVLEAMKNPGLGDFTAPCLKSSRAF